MFDEAEVKAMITKLMQTAYSQRHVTDCNCNDVEELETAAKMLRQLSNEVSDLQSYGEMVREKAKEILGHA